MGAESKIIAIGPFSKELKDDLNYDAGDYNQCIEGVTPIINETLACVTSQSSRDLASCFGFELYDFHKHFITSKQMLTAEPALTHFAVERHQYAQQVDTLLKMAHLGFNFYFVPDW